MNITFSSSITEKKELLTWSFASRNWLLQDLLSVPEIANDLLRELKVVNLSVNQVLFELGDQIDQVYFPIDAVASGLAIMEDGTTLETSLVGHEGMVGISTVLGTGHSRQWVWVTIGGTALQLDARVLDQWFVQNEVALKALLRRYRTLITQVSQRCVCNTRHTILERLCCWLLMIHDRVGSANLNLTQEMIASRVGARRAGITVAAGLLQEMKAIAYRRGHLVIQDREALKHAVCECYNVMHADFERLSPRTIQHSHYK